MTIGLRLFKRLCDFLFVLAVVSLFWLLIIIWIAVRLSSPGPGFLWQARVGRNEMIFHCLKFRTMKAGTASIGTHLMSPAAITPIGRFLRATKLDELPQAWNIVAGEMTLVGPRPCLPNQVELIAARRELGAFDAAPGITGWAQVHGIDMSDPNRLAMWDHSYLVGNSVGMECRIMFMTIFGSGARDKLT